MDVSIRGSGAQPGSSARFPSDRAPDESAPVQRSSVNPPIGFGPAFSLSLVLKYGVAGSAVKLGAGVATLRGMGVYHLLQKGLTRGPGGDFHAKRVNRIGTKRSFGETEKVWLGRRIVVNRFIASEGKMDVREAIGASLETMGLKSA